MGRASCLAYQPGSSCTVTATIDSKEFPKELKSVTCAGTGNELLNPFFNPGDKRAQMQRWAVARRKTRRWWRHLAINICQGTPVVGGCGLAGLEFGFPGLTTLIEPRTEYLKGGEKEEEGKGCEEGKLNEGHCYNAFFNVSVLGHVGSAAIKQEPTPQAKAPSPRPIRKSNS